MAKLKISIKIGSVLFNKESNCLVTITGTMTKDKIECAWFDKDNNAHKELVLLQDLEIQKEI